jgi:PRTRC genetic system protein A
LTQETNAPEGVGTPNDLFDMMGSEGEQFKPKKKEKAPAQKPASQGTKAQPSARPKRYPEGTLVVHQGDHKTLEKEMTEKEVYDLFNDDHPDVSMDRYELLEDKEKQRFWFKAKGFKKGGRPEEDGRPLTVLTRPPERGDFPAVCRLLGKDGVYEMRRSRLGSFIARIPSTLTVREGFHREVPKAPVRLLAEAVSVFRRYPETEAVLEIFHDRRDGSFTLFWPEQRGATAGGVTYDPLPETDDVFCYANLHSHNRMGAFFSRRDDEYDKRGGIYGVIGRVDAPRPEALFRLSCGGLFLPLRVADLFDDAHLANALVEEKERTLDPEAHAR